MQKWNCLGQIKNVDVGALTKDEIFHLRVPTVGLVSKVTASFKKLTHAEIRECHRFKSFFRLASTERSRPFDRDGTGATCQMTGRAPRAGWRGL